MHIKVFSGKKPYPEGVYTVMVGGQYIQKEWIYITEVREGGWTEDKKLQEGDIIISDGSRREHIKGNSLQAKYLKESPDCHYDRSDTIATIIKDYPKE